MQLEQRVRARRHRPQSLRLFRRHRPVDLFLEQFGHAEDAVQRRAQLVGDVGRELGLGAARLHQRVGPRFEGPLTLAQALDDQRDVRAGGEHHGGDEGELHGDDAEGTQPPAPQRAVHLRQDARLHEEDHGRVAAERADRRENGEAHVRQERHHGNLEEVDGDERARARAGEVDGAGHQRDVGDDVQGAELDVEDARPPRPPGRGVRGQLDADEHVGPRPAGEPAQPVRRDQEHEQHRRARVAREHAGEDLRPVVLALNLGDERRVAHQAGRSCSMRSSIAFIRKGFTNIPSAFSSAAYACCGASWRMALMRRTGKLRPAEGRLSSKQTS